MDQMISVVRIKFWEECEMEEIKLKPCPCCGEEAYTRIFSLHNERMGCYVSCNNPQCGLTMKFIIEPKSALLNFDDVINGLYDVAEKWNRRAGEQNE